MRIVSVTRRIEEAFGFSGFPNATFYKFENALRFELGGDLTDHVPRFLQAMDRARAVARATFRSSGRLTAVVSYFAGERRTRRQTDALRTLERIGFRHPLSEPERIPQNDEEHKAQFGTDICCYWHIADFENEPSQVDAILWANVARELGIQPRSFWLGYVYIVDFEKRLALNVYDHRGMDVFAMEREPIQPIYDAFGDWLLDHDRAVMDARFALRRL